MTEVTLKHKGEKFESLFRRFKKAVEKDGILKECRKREYYEKPCTRRKRARAAARKRHLKQVAENSFSRKRMY